MRGGDRRVRYEEHVTRVPLSPGGRSGAGKLHGSLGDHFGDRLLDALLLLEGGGLLLHHLAPDKLELLVLRDRPGGGQRLVERPQRRLLDEWRLVCALAR